MARNYTGRKHVLTTGYHGWHDEFVTLTPPASGVNLSNYIHKLEDLTQINNMVAAVIIEPIDLDTSDERIIWLRDLRTICDMYGVVLIFDEIITGMRYKDLSVWKHYEVKPDLLLLGKAVAAGMPLSIVGGRREIMDSDQYFVSSTFAGENASLAAMMKTIELLNTQRYQINDLWEAGEKFKNKFNQFNPKKIMIKGYSTRGRFFGDQDFINYFFQEAAKLRILFGPSWFINFCHEESMEADLHMIETIFNKMNTMTEFRLEGKTPSSPFTAKQRT
jgi:glutamate-1-semialdehyde aminotransferase